MKWYGIIDRMLRKILYGITGALIGIFFGAYIAALTNLHPTLLLIFGAFVGLVSAVGFAMYVNKRGLIGETFITRQDADTIGWIVAWDLRAYLPVGLRKRIGDRIRDYLYSKIDK